MKINYKKVIKNQKIRLKILSLLRFIPDSLMLKIQYRIKMGRVLNFQSTQRYSEKIQLYKMYYRNPLLGVCVDKYKVREYVKSKGLNKILNNIYGVYDDANDIDFLSLHSKFVIKTTDGGGGDNVLICTNKEELDIHKTVLLVNSWLNKKNINAGREWAYTQIEKSRIIIEEYLENPIHPKEGIQDYKFFCFSGKPFMVCVDSNRFIQHQRNIYDINWNKLNISFNDYPFSSAPCKKPKNYDQMLYIVKLLSEDFPHVRVDLYNVDGKIYFGELTFYPSSGYCFFSPDSFDFELGKQFDISSFYHK